MNARFLGVAREVKVEEDSLIHTIGNLHIRFLSDPQLIPHVEARWNSVGGPSGASNRSDSKGIVEVPLDNPGKLLYRVNL